MSNIGYHFPVEQWYTDADFDAAIKHLKVVQPEWSNVTAGSKPDRAMIFAERIVNETPTKVIYRQRNIQDDGIWTRMSAESWYNDHAKPLLNWAKRLRITLMTDNESVQSDMRPYAVWMANAMGFAGHDGLSLAVGAFSTGTPAENQYAQLDEMWEGIDYWNTRGVPMIWRPHEYFLKTPQESGGRINRYRLGWDRCKARGLPNPPTVIGEFGLGITSALGWRSQRGYQGNQYAADVQSYFQQWYEPQGVSVLVYSWADWPIPEAGKPITGFGVNNSGEFLSEMESFAIKRRAAPIVETPAPIVITTPPVPVEIPTPEPPPQETFPPPAPPVPEVLKRWSFGLEVLCTDFQSQMLQQGLEKLFEAAGFIGLAAGAQVSVQRKEMTIEVS